MKKVAVFVKNLTSGGAEKQSVLLAKALCSKCDVHYIVFNGKKLHEKYLDLLATDMRIHVLLIRGNGIKRLFLLFQYLRKQQIEVLFSYLTMANFISAIVGRIARVPLIYGGLRNAYLPWPKLISDIITCNILTTGFISNSFSGKSWFIQKGAKANRVVVIPNCFEGISPYMEKSPSSSVRIITVGRFVEQKDYETAIKAIKELREKAQSIEFFIIGYGRMETQIRRWIKEYGIEKITRLCINPDNIAELEQKSNIYLSTSVFEGTSNSIMEGMNANLPIVCTDVGDNRFLVENDENGYICKPGDYQGIANALWVLVEDAKKRNRFGRRSKEILSLNYNMEIFGQRYLDVMRCQ